MSDDEFQPKRPCRSLQNASLSGEKLALTSPNLVKKSSKDPNRGLYPKTSRKSSGKSFKNPSSFSKASSLIKEDDPQPSTSQCVDDGDIFDGIEIEQECSTFPSFNKASSLINSNKFKPTTSKCLNDSLNKASNAISPNPINSSAKSSESNTSSKSKDKLKNDLSLNSKAHKRSKSGKRKIAAGLESNKIFKYFPTLVPEGHEAENTNSSLSIVESINAKKKDKAKQKEADLLASQKKNENIFNKFRACYGLLGTRDNDEDDDENIDYFSRLPSHVLETIFCQIPILDLLNYRLVCKAWNNVINDNQFIEWKKTYYQLKLRRPEAFRYMKNLCYSLDAINAKGSISALIRFMYEKFGRKPSPDMYDLITKGTEIGQTAHLVLEERFPECLQKNTKAWSLLAICVVISQTVTDILKIHQSIVGINSGYSLHDLTNALYAISSFLLYFRSEFDINYGHHFRIYSALYKLENTPPISPALTLVKKLDLPGQQSIHKYSETTSSNLTCEQMRVLNHVLQRNQVVKIVALAGTGKTTTLIHFAKCYSQLKFLNVMFNSAVCQHARKIFPENVTCKTVHSLAYEIYGNQLKHKLSFKIRPHDIVILLEHKQGSLLHVHTYSRFVLNAIESFVCSVDEEISLCHVPTQDIVSGGPISNSDRTKLLKDSQQIWAKMIDKSDKMQITHDVYLKLYQLSKPKLTGYQCLMVDEAQDCNPAMLHVMTSQDLPLIVVGDPNQQIYGFRGAKNALQSIEATHTYHLTKSFRFGPDIAYAATLCLSALKRNNTDVLVGNDSSSAITGIRDGQIAIIARSNQQLFKEAVKKCSTRTIAASFAGGLASYRFNQLIDIYKLQSDAKSSISDKFVSKFNTFRDLVNYSSHVQDVELKSKIDIVNHFGMEIPSLVEKISSMCFHEMKNADFVFTTAHKSKGLEFDTVFLADDFPITNNSGRIETNPNAEQEQEYNILYVAMTRAKKSLVMSDELIKVINAAQEKLEYPMSTYSYLTLKEKQVPIGCAGCRDSFTPHTVLSTYRKELTSASGRLVQGGFLCMKCRIEPTFRPRTEFPAVILYLDPQSDNDHLSMSCLVGPLPNDSPLIYNSLFELEEEQIVEGNVDVINMDNFIMFRYGV